MKDHSQAEAFTLIELLVVIAIMAVLAALLLPTIARAKASTRRVQCINNQRQLLLVWQLYSADRNGQFVINGHNGLGPDPDPYWVYGSHGNVPTQTDPKYLVDPKFASFASHLRESKVYKCPADPGMVWAPGGPLPIIRSYGMNCHLGTAKTLIPYVSANYRLYRKASDLADPALRFVFLDGNPQSLCCPAFMVTMDAESFFHYPGTYHNLAAVVSFADGHVETHCWRDPRTNRRAPLYRSIPHHEPSAGNTDLKWLQQHATVPESSGGGRPIAALPDSSTRKTCSETSPSPS